MKKTGAERVIDYIREFGSITTLEAFRDLGIARLSARIYDLEREGYAFLKKTETAKNRFGENVHYTRYYLVTREGNS